MFFCFFAFLLREKKQKTLAVNVNGIEPSFIHGFPSVGENSTQKPDYFISAVKKNDSEWFPACSLNVPARSMHLYMNKTVTDKENKLIYLNYIISRENILKFYMSKGFSIISDPNIEHRYVLSLHEDSEELYPMPVEYSYIAFKRSVVVYQRKSDKSANPLCFKADISQFYNFAKVLGIVFLFLVILRIYFYKLPINMNSAKGDRFWFMSSSMVSLTLPAKLGLRNGIKLYHLINKAKRTKSSQHIILGITKTKDAVDIKRLDVYPFNDLYFVVYWTEEFSEIAEPMSYMMEGAELSSDDLYKVQKPPINLSYVEGRPVVDIPIPVSGRTGRLHIESNVTDDLAFGEYSLHLGYIDCIHLSMINQISDLSPTHEAFDNFVYNIFVKLDYTSLNIISITGSKIEEIAKFYKYDELQPIVESLIRKLAAEGADAKKISYRHVSQYKFIVNSFVVNNTKYYVITSCLSNVLSLKMPEQTFHFIMSMLVTYHHSAVSSKGNARRLMRIYDLIKNTEIFSLIECVGEPSKFNRAVGKLFGQEITQEVFDQFFAKIPKETVKKLTEKEDGDEFDRLPVEFMHSSGERKWINISSISYYDEAIESMVYSYLVEDISKMKECSIQLESINEEVRIASEFLGLHKIHSDLTLPASNSLSQELGYTTNVRSFKSLLYEEDKEINFAAVLSKKKEIKVRLTSALGFPVVYSMISISSDDGYFVFAPKYMRQLRAIAKCEKEKKLEANEEDFIVIIYNNTTQKTKYVDSAGKVIDGVTIEEALTPVLLRALPEGKHLFEENYKKVFIDKEEFVSFEIKLTTELKGYCWYKVSISNKFGGVMFYMRNVHAKKMNKLMMQEMSRRADSFLESSQIFYWTFTDTHSESNVYLSAPAAGSHIIIDWKTLEKNSDKDAALIFAKSIAEHSNIEAPITFISNGKKKYIIRGTFKDNVLSGVGIDINWIDRAINDISQENSDDKNENAEKKLKIDTVLQAVNMLIQLSEEEGGNSNDLLKIGCDCVDEMKTIITSYA